MSPRKQPKFHRQLLQLTPAQKTYLEDEAAGLGISTSELMRRILDEYRGCRRRQNLAGKIDELLEVLTVRVKGHKADEDV